MTSATTYNILLQAASDGCGFAQYLLSDIDAALEDGEISSRQAAQLKQIIKLLRRMQ